MTTRKALWPVYKSHDTAPCFNCGGDFGDGYYSDSGYGPRNGQWKQACERCGYLTFYDLEQPDRTRCRHEGGTRIFDRNCDQCIENGS